MKLLPSLFLLLNLVGYSQIRTIHGAIKDKENKTALQYVSVGIANKGVGTVSNVEGKFSLAIDENIHRNDTVSFSMLGYRTKKIAITKLHLPNNSIELEPQDHLLDEVVVRFVKPKARKIGRSSKGLGLMHYNFYSYYEKDVDDRLSKEIGMQFKLKKDCKVNNLNFNITSNEFRSLKFRLNFYKIENDFPSQSIIDKDIIFEIQNEFKGWYTLDLQPYEIYLDKENEDIAVSIQWVESKKANVGSKYFGISTAVSPTETCFFREKAMDSWKKSGQSLSFYLNTMCK